MIIAIVGSVQLGCYASIFQGIQSLISYIAPPITAVFLWGVFLKRASAIGAVTTLVLGTLLGFTVFVLNWNKEATGWSVPFLMAAFYLFIICFVILFTATFDLSYLEDVLTRDQALALLTDPVSSRPSREGILTKGYPGYDTSVGWFNYDDDQDRTNCKRAIDAAFTAMKLKDGSRDPERDLRRALIVRDVAGPDTRVMVDANQQWTMPQALDICARLKEIDPFWIEEPTHPDDIIGHKTLAHAIAPVKLALGEHMLNRVIFKNYLQAKCAGFIQVDAVRVAGVSEILAVSLMCKQSVVPLVPHVGDMGQLHQHLVLFNHIGLDLPVVFLEHIPHLRDHFVNPVRVENGVYRTPHDIGASYDLL